MSQTKGYSPRQNIQNIQNPYTLSLNSYQIGQNGQYSPSNFHNYNINRKNGRYGNQFPTQSTYQRNGGPIQYLNLNDNQSFARNFKSRLYNSDPKQQKLKEDKAKKYREQLRIQIEQDARRKQEEKKQQKQYDMKLQQKIQQNIKIQAQQKGNKKNQPNFFVVHSSKAQRKKHNLNESRNIQDLKVNNFMRENDDLQKIKIQNTYELIKKPDSPINSPIIIRRGGYHNQSSLDKSNIQINPQEVYIPEQKHGQNNNKQIESQNSRIQQLMLFQRKMIKKLELFKKQIYNTSNNLNITQQLEKVRFRLRAKPLNLNKIFSRNPKDGIEDFFMNQSQFYQLPYISKKNKIYEGQRELRKKKLQNTQHLLQNEEDKPIVLPKQIIQLKDRPLDIKNDKNFIERSKQESVFQDAEHE